MLHDIYAMAALIGLMTQHKAKEKVPLKVYAKAAHKMAHEMLEERPVIIQKPPTKP